MNQNLIRFFWISVFCVNVTFARINKCCPQDEVLQCEEVEDNNLSPLQHFSCIKKSLIINNDIKFNKCIRQQKKQPNNFTTPFNSSILREIIGYNILIDEYSHIPTNCGDNNILSLILLGNISHKVSELGSCVDVMENQIYILNCEERTESDMMDILKLKKCCPMNYSYDIFGRKCVVNNDTNVDDNFNHFLGSKMSSVFEIGFPQCRDEDVLVEYHSNVHKLLIHDNALIITATPSHGPEVLLQKTFCIENTFNSDVELTDGIDSNHFLLKASSKWIAKACRSRNVCKFLPCIRKCCREGERMVFDNITSCEKHDTDFDPNFHFFDYTSSPEQPQRIEPSEYGIMQPKYCLKYLIESEEKIHFLSGIDGSLFVPSDEKFYSNEQYCVDYFYYLEDDNLAEIKMETFVCFGEADNLRFYIYATLLAISAAFFFATFLVYICLPKLLNLHGKTVVCHVISLFVAYAALSGVQYTTDVKYSFCKLIAFTVYFSFLSAFSWLNVMCFDIWWTFGSLRIVHGMRKATEMKRFIIYSIYAWGFPLIMSIVTFMVDFYQLVPDIYLPKIGESTCWFDENISLGHTIFFLGIIAVQNFVNICFFIVTAIHCNRIKSEIHRMQMTDNSEQKKKRFISDRAKFILILKLFIVMGLSWLFEIVATIFDKQRNIWMITDFVNLMQGVLVFFIFVCKRKVLMAFQKKLGIKGLRGPKSGSTATTMSTLDLHSTSKYSGKITKSNSTSTLTNSTINTTSLKN